MSKDHRISQSNEKQLNSLAMSLIEQTLDTYNRLLLKQQSCKIQLDGIQGQQFFKVYTNQLQKLIAHLKVKTSDRLYRTKYTNAYKVLYNDDSLGYIPQIYDSAQEGIPFIYVNGDRYDFSTQVLILGEQLVEAYYRLSHQLRITVLKVTQENQQQINYQKQQIDILMSKVALVLQQFDTSWIKYQQVDFVLYRETHSKAAIKTIIKAEQALRHYEEEQKLMGKIFISGIQYDKLRKNLCQHISRLNSVANIDGKGRDDLSFQILAAAQYVLTTVTDFQSKSVRILAEKIRQSFQNVRQVLKYFSQSFDMVDPQLKNNPELVLALQQYESYWQKGKRYIVQPKKQNQILAFSTIVEAAKQKYPNFCQLIDYSDPSIFWIIPSLIVLRNLEGQDEGLTQSFFTTSQKQIDLLSLKDTYEQLKKVYKEKQIYNSLQSILIGNLQNKYKDNKQLLSLATKIKEIAVSLQRVSPMDWNDMLGVLLLQS